MQPKQSSHAQPNWQSRLHPYDNVLYMQGRAFLKFGTVQSNEGFPPSPVTLPTCGSFLRVRGLARICKGKVAREFPIGIRAGTLSMDLVALGPRMAHKSQWSRARFSPPEYMESCPLQANFAMGGQSKGLAFPPNPHGCGFALQGDPALQNGIPLPRLENPLHRLTPRNWPLNRWSRWEKLPAPWIPDGSLSSSHPLQQKDAWMPGTSIHLSHCLPESPDFVFTLPSWSPRAALVEDGLGRTAPMELRGVDLHLDSGIATLDYWAAFPIPAATYLASLKELQYGIVP